MRVELEVTPDPLRTIAQCGHGPICPIGHCDHRRLMHSVDEQLRRSIGCVSNDDGCERMRFRRPTSRDAHGLLGCPPAETGLRATLLESHSSEALLFRLVHPG